MLRAVPTQHTKQVRRSPKVPKQKKKSQILTNQKFLSLKMLDDKIMLMVTQIKNQ